MPRIILPTENYITRHDYYLFIKQPVCLKIHNYTKIIWNTTFNNEQFFLWFIPSLVKNYDEVAERFMEILQQFAAVLVSHDCDGDTGCSQQDQFYIF